MSHLVNTATNEAVSVTLNPTEFFIAAQVGLMRRVASVQRGHKERHGSRDIEEPIFKNINGACGEMAAAKVLGRYWDGSVNGFKQVDIPSNLLFGMDGIQVRTMGRHHYDLLVRPGDSDADKFVLVTGEGPPSYKVHGWILGSDAKRPQWLEAKGGRDPAYFVPQNMLRPLIEISSSICGTCEEATDGQ